MLDSWHHLLESLLRLGTSTDPVSVVEKIIRPVVVYLLLVFALRAFGKRILAQLNPFDFVVLLTLSNTVQNAIIGNDTSLSGGIIGAAALLAINHLLVRLYYRGPKVEHTLLEERDIYLVRNHQMQESELTQLHINRGELIAKAHERGFDDLSEVETAVLYPNGTIYMKGNGSTDSNKLSEVLERLGALQRDVAALRLKP